MSRRRQWTAGGFSQWMKAKLMAAIEVKAKAKAKLVVVLADRNESVAVRTLVEEPAREVKLELKKVNGCEEV